MYFKVAPRQTISAAVLPKVRTPLVLHYSQVMGPAHGPWEILTQHNTYLSDHSSKILPLILQFIRVAPINLNLAEAMIHCNETLAYHDATPSALADGPWSPAAVRERGQAIDVAWEHEPKQPKLPCFAVGNYEGGELCINCLLYTSPSPRDS